MEPDKVIAMTINKDTKTTAGTTGFSRIIGAIRRWELNASYRVVLRSCLYGYVNYATQNYSLKNLIKSRIRKDENDIQSVIDIFLTIFKDPFSESDLIRESNGMLAKDELKTVLVSAQEKGEETINNFTKDRLKSR